MKICMITEDYPPDSGGGGFFVKEISKRLSAEHAIRIMARGKDEKITEENGKIELFRFSGNRLCFLFKSVWNLINSPPFDIYHAHGSIPGVVCKCVSVFKKRPIILHVHGFRDKEVIGRLKYFCQNFILKLGYDKIISVDRESSKKIIKSGVPENKIVMIPVGVDTEKFFPQKKSYKSKTIFLFVGRLVAVKDIFTLLKAAKPLQEKNMPFEIWIVGAGELKSSLQDFCQKNRIENIRFFGMIPHNEVIDIYNKADFFVLPSLSEGNPLVLLEAMACGLPVLTSDISSLKGIVDESGAGFYFSVGNEKACSELLEKTATLPSQNYTKLSKKARAYAQKYSWEKVSKDINSVYVNILK